MAGGPFNFYEMARDLNKVKVFSGSYSLALSKRIAASYGSEMGAYTCSRFSDGEISFSYDESVRGSYLFLIQSTAHPAESIMELLIMIDAAKRASASYVTVVIPYFGYGRQDRKDKPRVAITAKLMANLLSAAGSDRVVTMDFHANQIQGFFDIPVDHLNGNAVFIPYLESLPLDDIVFVAPDVGGLPRVRVYARHFDAGMAVCNKERKKANEVGAMQVIGDVRGRHAVLIDDMIDTGGTLCRAAEVLLERGCKSVRACCTHAVLSGEAHQNLLRAGLEEVAVTNTLPLERENEKIKVLGVEDIFARSMRNLQTEQSISSLFIA